MQKLLNSTGFLEIAKFACYFYSKFNMGVCRVPTFWDDPLRAWINPKLEMISYSNPPYFGCLKL